MTIFQALRYFFVEAVTGLVRSLRVSLLAIFTIAVSIFLSGALFAFSQNLARMVADWRSQARLVVYLDRDVAEAGRAAVKSELEHGPARVTIREVPPDEAARRFTRAFPSLAALVTGGTGALPFSFELEVAPASREAVAAWLERIRALDAVEMVDADEDWIGQMETLLAIVRGVGFALTAILLGASVFTIASVVRLTSFLYRDEIAVMRLVGATEFYIRGPFYVEGIVQGILGGGLAVGALNALDFYLRRSVASSAFAGLFAEHFLTRGEFLLLVLFGAAAGWLGAVVSLGRENLQGSGN